MLRVLDVDFPELQHVLVESGFSPRRRQRATEDVARDGIVPPPKEERGQRAPSGPGSSWWAGADFRKTIVVTGGIVVGAEQGRALSLYSRAEQRAVSCPVVRELARHRVSVVGSHSQYVVLGARRAALGRWQCRPSREGPGNSDTSRMYRATRSLKRHRERHPHAARAGGVAAHFFPGTLPSPGAGQSPARHIAGPPSGPSCTATMASTNDVCWKDTLFR